MFLDWLVRLIIAGLGLLSAACYAQTSTCGVTMQTAQSNFRNIDVPGAQSTFASGINNSGTIVGTFADAAGVVHGYLDNVDGDSFRQIDFPGSTSTGGGGLNDGGDIVGEYTDSSGLFHGFLLSDGTFSTIDFLPLLLLPAELTMGAASQGPISMRTPAFMVSFWTRTSSQPWMTLTKPS